MSDNALVRQEDSISAEAAPEQDSESTVNLPPGRLHATRVTQRLSGSSLTNLVVDNSTASLHIPPSLTLKRQPRGMNDGSQSRSRSPSLHRGERTPTTMDANSSVSSLDEIRELTIQDILTDRAGLSESIDLAKEKALHNSFTMAPMPPVAERMSDEALEDCHAFSDVRSYSSRNSSAKGVDANGDVSIALEPLNECDESDDDLEDIDEESDNDGDHEQQSHPQVILTNLDNLTLKQDMMPDGESEPFNL